MPPPTVCVVGSANLDLNAYVDRFPAPGETLHGGRFTTGYGGKGANQAVAAARLGAAVSLVARVGDDLFGRDMLANFQAEGIDTRFVTPTANTSTGTAVITVDAAGRNTIVVTPGANGLLTKADVEVARAAIELAKVLVLQQEVPTEANVVAMRIARQAGRTIVYNPAPAGDDLPPVAWALIDVLCPNEHEATLLSGLPTRTTEEAETAASELLKRGVGAVVLTLGERGCLVARSGARADPIHIPAPAVTAVDTTGAGDAFIGALAFCLARGDDLVDAARRATRVAAVSVQAPGTQTSFSRAADLPADVMAK